VEVITSPCTTVTQRPADGQEIPPRIKPVEYGGVSSIETGCDQDTPAAPATEAVKPSTTSAQAVAMSTANRRRLGVNRALRGRVELASTAATILEQR
jgi:hypothetical protein